jgi:hypothetical protein
MPPPARRVVSGAGPRPPAIGRERYRSDRTLVGQRRHRLVRAGELRRIRGQNRFGLVLKSRYSLNR